MKVVLFCGGLGTRLREHSETIPKPLVNIGYRPIIWHLMRYYAHFGHKEFILCLGYKGDMIKKFFLNFEETASNDFALSNGGKTIELFNRDIADWRITFVDTGLQSNIGQRLCAVRHHLDDDDVFMANYSDGLTNLDLDTYVERANASKAVATVLGVRNAHSFHAITSDKNGWVESIGPLRDAPFRINGGFFVLRREIFDYIRDGEELVEEPFQRLAAERKLYMQTYEGFWRAMDTLKDKLVFDQMNDEGNKKWEVWWQPNNHRPPNASDDAEKTSQVLPCCP
jgi:glucose-1-phosphate cytidylyltransferase